MLSMISGVARAQEPPPRDANDPLTAEELEREAWSHRDAGSAHARGEPGGDPDGFAKCAAAFLELYNRFENHDRPDVLLWNAAYCFDASGQVGQAVQARTALLERYPESELARDTLHYLAKSYDRITDYEDAATRYEQFAALYTKDERTPDALQNAYLFRIGLDQREQAKRDLDEYERLYQRKDVKKSCKKSTRGSRRPVARTACSRARPGPRPCCRASPISCATGRCLAASAAKRRSGRFARPMPIWPTLLSSRQFRPGPTASSARPSISTSTSFRGCARPSWPSSIRFAHRRPTSCSASRSTRARGSSRSGS